MNPFEMVVIIVLICTVGGIIAKILQPRSAEGVDVNGNCSPRRGPWRHHGHAWGTPNGTQTVDMKPYVAKIEALEERIRVLERIVTDKSERLKRELDELED